MSLRDTSNRPYVDNYPPLKAWLHKHKARCNFQVPLGDPAEPRAYVEQWLIGTRLCIITVWSNHQGWELYTPGDSLKIDETLADAERRLGVT